MGRSTFQPIQNTTNTDITYTSLRSHTNPILESFRTTHTATDCVHPTEFSQQAEIIQPSAVESVISQPVITKEGHNSAKPKEDDLRIMEKLEMITNQMDILTQTVAIIEQRLTNTEDKLNYLMTSKTAQIEKNDEQKANNDVNN